MKVEGPGECAESGMTQAGHFSPSVSPKDGKCNLITLINTHKYPIMLCFFGISMTEGTQKDLVIGVVAGSIVMVVMDLAIPFAGPLVGGFTAGYLAKGDVLQAGKAGVLAAILAAIFIAIGVYQKLVHSQVEGFVAGWGTGLLLYLIIGLYFIGLGFLGSIIASAIRK